MSFASLRVFTYAYPVSFLSKCHAKNRKEVLAVRTSYRKEVLALLSCSRKEVLVRALFLGCTVPLVLIFTLHELAVKVCLTAKALLASKSLLVERGRELPCEGAPSRCFKCKANE